MSAPRDLVRAAVAKYTPLHPTVFIFHCTFVCDARCEMCSNWTRGNRKEDMTLEQIEKAFESNLWKDIENASISGGEPTTRNDLVDIRWVPDIMSVSKTMGGGLPLAAVLSAGQLQEISFAVAALEAVSLPTCRGHRRTKPRKLAGDKGYSANRFRQ